MDFMDFNFVKKTKGRRAPSDKDISVVTSENGGGATYFTFRNEVFDDIAPNTGCFVYAVVGSRIYFKEASSVDGYSFTSNKKSDKKAEKRYASFGGKLHHPLYEFMKDKTGTMTWFSMEDTSYGSSIPASLLQARTGGLSDGNF